MLEPEADRSRQRRTDHFERRAVSRAIRQYCLEVDGLVRPVDGSVGHDRQLEVARPNCVRWAHVLRRLTADRPGRVLGVGGQPERATIPQGGGVQVSDDEGAGGDVRSQDAVLTDPEPRLLVGLRHEIPAIRPVVDLERPESPRGVQWVPQPSVPVRRQALCALDLCGPALEI